ncbi:ATP-binding protein [Algicola sagamiensis]|uniref:ATP-binding protein n=1 Tax=Algicola sagamiensis TaxID=163869 RepID=UPI00036789AA|nr:ATP-binding protein [Algicola sagamiensis]
MQFKSISRRLLTNVLSVYFLLTFIVTCGQIVAEYLNTKNLINDELAMLQKTFSGSLTRAIWELNTQQALTIAEGLLAIPMIEGVVVRGDNADVLTQIGKIIDVKEKYSNQLVQDGVILEDRGSGLFGYTFPLIFEFSGRATQVGDVTLFSSREVVFNRIMVSILFLIGNAIVKTTFLIVLFLIAFRRLLTDPLNDITQQISELELDNLEGAQINIHTKDNNELKIMEQAFNNVLKKVEGYKDDLQDTQKQLVVTNEKLDQQNLTLEQDVARKTSNLSRVMIDLQQQKNELEKQQSTLQDEIERRSNTEKELLAKQSELQKIVDDLNVAQDRLVQSEKLAAIGGLVAGITHEVNTPVGIGVTATSFLQERLKQLQIAFDEKKLSAKAFEAFITEANQSVDLLTTNLNRASELIASFKQIAVDQASEAVRTININGYIDEIIRSLHPKLKKTNHQIHVNCPESLLIKCPAGAISQIFTNLIINSVIHGFEGVQSGTINIDVTDEGDDVHIVYSDNGHGLDEEQLEQLFDPFFTTKREQGGSGLGTHITYNLVKQTLGGDIEISSKKGEGLTYDMRFPKETRTDDDVFGEAANPDL